MESVVTLEKWLKRGRQRAAVLRVLRKPMPASEISRAAREFDPHIQLRDLWLILPQLKERGIVTCLTPRQGNGRLFVLTALARKLARHTFSLDVAPEPGDVDWHRYSWVVRARVRRATLLGLATLLERDGKARTATEVRKAIRGEFPVSLNPVLRSLKELLAKSLVRVAGTTADHRRQYSLTPAGRRIADQLRR